jgi:hypothetical protein
MCTWKRCAMSLAVVVAVVIAAPAQTLLKNPTTGNPNVKSVDAISFGPQGLLLIGDSKGRQLVAVDTGDTKPLNWTKTEVAGIKDQLAGRIGTTAKGIEINKLAVNPASHTAYFAIRGLDTKMDMILTLDGSGKISDFPLDNVKYVAVPLPQEGKTAKITDIAWAGDRVLVAAQAGETFSSRILSVIAPLGADKTGVTFSTKTFHVGHNKWETQAPLRVVIPYEEDGKKHVVGSFTCTPIVKYPLDDVKPNAEIKGTSVIELGTGNTPQDMFTYEKNGKTYILMNQFRGAFGKGNPVGPSPYWTAKVDQAILRETTKINENAIWRVKKGGKASEPLEDAKPFVSVIAEYHGVTHMDKLDRERALVVQLNDKGIADLRVLNLP